MKIAVAQTRFYPGQIDRNVQTIKQWINRAEGKADLLVFPELCIPGYLSMDLFLDNDFIAENLDALDEIKDYTKGKSIQVLVGFVDLDRLGKIRPDGKTRRYNSVAVLENGEIKGIQDKTLLPDYNIFYERRYFETARTYSVFTCQGTTYGIEVCEDMWNDGYDVNPTSNMSRMNVSLIVNVSASPYNIGKYNTRYTTIAKNALAFKTPCLYANMIGSYDGYDGQVLFDGRSFFVDRMGHLKAQAEAFEESLMIVFFEDALDSNQIRYNENEMQTLHKGLVLGIRDYCDLNGFTQAVIGLSGGVDSALVAALAAEALGAKNVHGITMPSDYSSSGSVNDSAVLAENLGIHFNMTPIKNLVQSYKDSLVAPEFDTVYSQDYIFSGDITGTLTEENIQARIRGNILMAFSNKTGAILLSTGNKTETALGYCTMYGDMAGGLAIISDVNKVLVYALCDYINQVNEREIIPQSILEKAPSAELAPGQSDEKSLGAAYATICPIVDSIVEGTKTINQLKKEYDKDLVDKYNRLIKRAEYKRRQAAPGIRVSGTAFGIGRRMPMFY